MYARMMDDLRDAKQEYKQVQKEFKIEKEQRAKQREEFAQSLALATSDKQKQRTKFDDISFQNKQLYDEYERIQRELQEMEAEGGDEHVQIAQLDEQINHLQDQVQRLMETKQRKAKIEAQRQAQR